MTPGDLIVVPPQIAPFSFGDEPMNAGDSASVQCSITKGDPPVEIAWLLSGRRIAKNEGIAVMRMKRLSVISIEHVSEDYAGNYTCSVKNKAGSTEHTALLVVNGTETSNAWNFRSF